MNQPNHVHKSDPANKGVPLNKVGRAKLAQKKKRKRIKIIVGAVLALIVLIISGVLVYTYSVLGSKQQKEITKDPNELGIDSEYQETGKYADIVNIALFGIDSRGNNIPGHSDALMILSINRKKNEVKIISIMRDSYVNVDGYGKTKITNAYFFGGPTLALKTLNQNYNLNIKDYVTVTFDSMAKVIDAVGGVTINVTDAELGNANHNIQEYANVWNITPTYIDHSGEQLLNGMQAVGYARIRYIGNADYQRTERQRAVMEQLFDKALKMNPLEYPKLLSTVMPLVETSLSSNDILGIGVNVMKSGSAQFQQERFPLNNDIITNGTIDGETVIGGNIDDVSYVVSDLRVTAKKLHDYIFDDVDPDQNTYTAPATGTPYTPKSTTKAGGKQTTTKPGGAVKQTTTTQPGDDDETPGSVPSNTAPKTTSSTKAAGTTTTTSSLETKAK